MVSVPRAVLSECFENRMDGLRLKSAVFLTFCFDPGFFEQEILPVFLDVAPSHAPAVRLVLLEESIRDHVDHIAVYYDYRALEAGAAGAKLDVQRVPARWPNGAYFHPKNVLLLVEGAPKKGEAPEERLLVATLSANLTRAGWWENVEACHIEELHAGEKSLLQRDIRNLVSQAKRACPSDMEHPALDSIRRFVVNEVELRTHRTSGRRLEPRLYVGVADGSAAREGVASFLRGQPLRRDIRLNLEVISPYFDAAGEAKPLQDLIEVFDPKEVRVSLPIGPDGKALCRRALFDGVRRLPNTRWGRLPADLLRSGASEAAAPRRVHAKVYRLFSESPRYEVVFVGSVNLTRAAHQEGGNFETAFLIESEPNAAPDWWLSVASTPPTEFLHVGEDEGLGDGPGSALSIRFDWRSEVAAAFWSGPDRSPAMQIEAQGSPLFGIAPLPPRGWRKLGGECAAELKEKLSSTSFLTVTVEGARPAVILVQEEGMAHKPSILMNLSVSDILRCWADLSDEQRAVLLEERYQELSAAAPGAFASALLPKALLGTTARATIFDAFAGIFHAFANLERRVLAALDEGRETLAIHLLFGRKYDSLPHLLDRVLNEEVDVANVNRYVILLCARQLLEQVRARRPGFLERFREEVRSLKRQLDETERVRQTLRFRSAEDRAAFLEWFETWFLNRAEPAGVAEQ